MVRCWTDGRGTTSAVIRHMAVRKRHHIRFAPRGPDFEIAPSRPKRVNFQVQRQYCYRNAGCFAAGMIKALSALTALLITFTSSSRIVEYSADSPPSVQKLDRAVREGLGSGRDSFQLLVRTRPHAIDRLRERLQTKFDTPRLGVLAAPVGVCQQGDGAQPVGRPRRRTDFIRRRLQVAD